MNRKRFSYPLTRYEKLYLKLRYGLKAEIEISLQMFGYRTSRKIRELLYKIYQFLPQGPEPPDIETYISDRRVNIWHMKNKSY